MSKPANIQVGQVVPTQINLGQGEFLATLLPILASSRIGWSADQHIQLVDSIIGRLKDEKGAAPWLDAVLKDRLKLIFRPTEDLQRSVLRQTFADAGYTLAPETEKTLVMLLSAPQFADFLSKAENPETKKPFIEKEKKRGVKKNTFTSLIASVLPPPALATLPVEEPVNATTEEETVK